MRRLVLVDAFLILKQKIRAGADGLMPLRKFIVNDQTIPSRDAASRSRPPAAAATITLLATFVA